MKNKAHKINYLQNFTLIATFFSLWIATYFENDIEDVLAYTLILSLGILHGTNDIKLIQKANNIKGLGVFFNVLILYIGFVLIGIALFYVLPFPLLLIFILCSAYHFGEQHWHAKLTNFSLTSDLFYTFYGLTIFFLLFFTNYREVNPIIQNLTGVATEPTWFLYILLFCATSFIGLGIRLFLIKTLRIEVVQELFFLLVFYIVFHTASLLWAFAIYFIFWHSIPSLADQVVFLYGTHKKKDFIKYLKSSFIYWMVTILGLLLLYWVLRNEDKLFLSIFFTLIAAITFPHVWVMNKLNKR